MDGVVRLGLGNVVVECRDCVARATYYSYIRQAVTWSQYRRQQLLITDKAQTEWARSSLYSFLDHRAASLSSNEERFLQRCLSLPKFQVEPAARYSKCCGSFITYKDWLQGPTRITLTGIIIPQRKEAELAWTRTVAVHLQTVAHHPVVRYDTRCYFSVRSKADMSLLNLPHLSGFIWSNFVGVSKVVTTALSLF